MQKTNRKSLSLQRNTLRSLTGSEMADAQGGTFTSITNRPTLICPPTSINSLRCPSLVDGCPSATGPSIVINPIPSGGF
jgi:hypothetical protein